MGNSSGLINLGFLGLGWLIGSILAALAFGRWFKIQKELDERDRKADTLHGGNNHDIPGTGNGSENLGK